MNKKIDKQNYFDFIPIKNCEIKFCVDENNIIILTKEWTGFYHKIAQKFFKKPKCSQIKLDNIGSFIWQNIDGKSNVYELSEKLLKFDSSIENHVSRLIKFLEILKEHKFIFMERR